MESKEDRGLLWLHLICCGGPLLAVALAALVPLLITFVLTYRIWVLAAGIGLALGAALIWRRRRRCASQPASSSNQLDRMEPAFGQGQNTD